MGPHTVAGLSAAKAAIAAAHLSALPDAELGQITLRDDQRQLVSRARRALDRMGGCLIGDDVGRGKTYVALALAHSWKAPLIVVPASLRTTWRSAMERAAVRGELLSHEALSRGATPTAGFDGIVVDESHHFRTTATRRYAALCEMSSRGPLVLLSATPLQNRARDLAAQVALFLGESAFGLSGDQLARFVIRGDDAPIAAMPLVAAPSWVELDVDDAAVLEAILALPAPPRPLDAGDAGVLRTINLVRAWASSRAALRATLRERSRLATAVEQGVEVGRVPTRREARAWHGVEDVVQLGFASLLVAANSNRLTPGSTEDHGGDIGELHHDLLVSLEAERRGMERISACLSSAIEPDAARVRALRSIRAEHPSARIIAFSEFASTVRAFYAALRWDAGIGMLTSREARISSGQISRDELLARFAPVAQGGGAVPERERVTLLLTTDLLSEGVNLQDASIVVHLDLPWNPARLAQRVGRVRRPGGAREVRAYLMAPPANAAALLQAEARLRRKLADAERVVGASFDVMPVLTRGEGSTGVRDPGALEALPSARAEGQLATMLATWRGGATAVASDTILVAACEAPQCGWMVALRDGRLFAAIGDGAPDEIASPLRVAQLTSGAERCPRDAELLRARQAIDRWLEREALGSACGLDAAAVGPLRRAVLSRVNQVAQSLGRHERAALLPVISGLRAVLCGPLPLGAERAVARHAALPIGDAGHWLAVASGLQRPGL